MERLNWFLWQLQIREGAELLAHGFDFLQGGGLRDQAGLAEGAMEAESWERIVTRSAGVVVAMGSKVNLCTEAAETDRN